MKVLYSIIIAFAFIHINVDAQNIDLILSDIYLADGIHKAKFINGFAELRKDIPEKYRKLQEGEVFDGGKGVEHLYNFDLKSMLSLNDQFVYIPTRSYIVFHFIDGISNIENSIDLMIQSCGDPCGCGKQSLDSALISVSQNGRKYIDLGIIKSKESKKYDFEDFRVAEKIHFVKVTGLSAQEFPYGFELMNLIAFKQKPVLVRMEKELIEKEDIVPVYATEHFILPDLLFEFNSSTINQSQQSMLDSVYTRITEVVVDKISILGHTDARGDEDYNMKLSNERAQSVKVYLLQKGVDQNLIITKGYGENMLLPKIDNLDLRNRRVEIEITIRK